MYAPGKKSRLSNVPTPHPQSLSPLRGEGRLKATLWDLTASRGLQPKGSERSLGVCLRFDCAGVPVVIRADLVPVKNRVEMRTHWFNHHAA